MTNHETPPIDFTESAESVHPKIEAPELPPGLAASLAADGVEISTALADRTAESRDWWPLSIVWALENTIGARAGGIARPTNVEQVSTILRRCNETGTPVIAAGGRSGVSGGVVPVQGGILLDLRGLSGIVSVDATSMVLDVRAGTFGDDLETELANDHAVTVGHWPQSMALATVGGWLACRGAGQLSTRYGKIEDIVLGLDVVLANGEIIHTGRGPRSATGPDLTQLFIGSEGTLGIITGARLRLHPAPPCVQQAAYAFADFSSGIDACRRILQRGATPAVLRLYDHVEGERNFQSGDVHPLLVRDEGDANIIAATMHVVADECTTVPKLDTEILDRWMAHRNDVSALERFIRAGAVVDTMEIAVDWAEAATVYDRTRAAIQAIDGTVAVSAHLSHSYTSGCCLYFTFGGMVDAPFREHYYKSAWDAGQRAVLRAGGNLSHHHGVGMNRARFMPEALGGGMRVLESIKSALDPNGILNPGKLGLGATGW